MQLFTCEAHLTHLSLVLRLHYRSPTHLVDFDTDELRKGGERDLKHYCRNFRKNLTKCTCIMIQNCNLRDRHVKFHWLLNDLKRSFLINKTENSLESITKTHSDGLKFYNQPLVVNDVYKYLVYESDNNTQWQFYTYLCAAGQHKPMKTKKQNGQFMFKKINFLQSI